MTPEANELLQQLHGHLRDAPYVMLGLQDKPASSEPMTAKFDEQCYPAQLYFYTRTDNRLVRSLYEVSRSHAFATYASPKHELFAVLSGQLTLIRDPALARRFWSDDVAAWFSKGLDDPMLQVIGLEVSHAEIWKADLSLANRVKLMFGGDIARGVLEGMHANANV